MRRELKPLSNPLAPAAAAGAAIGTGAAVVPLLEEDAAHQEPVSNPNMANNKCTTQQRALPELLENCSEHFRAPSGN